MASTRALPVWVRYGATTLLVGACLVLRMMVLGREPSMPYLLFLPAIMAAGIIFDHGTGVYATLVSAALAVWFFVLPSGSLAIAGEPAVLELVVFLAISLFTAALLESLHTALSSLATERAELAGLNEQLHSMAAQRGTLLSEAVHRARNDLQRLAATLRLQAGASADEAVREALQDASSRVAALARINGRLDRHREEDGRAEVESRGFLEGLVSDLEDAAVDMRPIALSVVAESTVLPMARAVAIGQIVNELIGNALKYAFPREMSGHVDVVFRREGDMFLLLVRDDGVGADLTAPPDGTGLGLRISRALAGQLGGKLELAAMAPGTDRPGLCGLVRFPAR